MNTSAARPLMSSAQGLLFDLDGTLADTAPDLLAALVWLCERYKQSPPPIEQLRGLVSQGAAGMIAAAFQGAETDDMRDEFVERYRAQLWQHSMVFPGVRETLDQLRALGMPMAVVTNKVEALALPVLEQSGLLAYFSCVIAGDTAARPKPAADPVLAACESLGVPSSRAILVGDDARDVAAAHAAGAQAAIAGWGYLPSEPEARQWGARHWFDQPTQLLTLLAPGGVTE
jgi:phosphoglycolate phosphatase